MLPFFRRIRLRLARDNDFIKYSRYAFGEIVLVVIGILIALQINNWNEKQKAHKNEFQLLEDFRESLQEDLNVILVNERIVRSQNFAIDVLLQCLETDMPYNDSLNYHFASIMHNPKIRISSEVFETLQSNGLELISNKSLKHEIITYYGLSKELSVYNDRFSDVLEDASKKILPTRFDGLYIGEYYTEEAIDTLALIEFGLKGNIRELGMSMVPNDYEKLKEDNEYLYFLRSLKNQLFWYMRLPLANRKMVLVKLIQSVEQELRSQQ